MAKGIFIAENMASTKLGSLLRSAKQATAIENGAVVVLNDLVTGENELYTSEGVSAKTDVVYLVDGVELIASEETTKGLDDFENLAGVRFRTRKPMVGDRFSISESMITGEVADGDIVETPASGNKLVKVATATADVSLVCKVVKTWVFGTRAIPMVRLEVVKVG